MSDTLGFAPPCGIAGPHLDGLYRLGIWQHTDGTIEAHEFPFEGPLPAGYRDPLPHEIPIIRPQLFWPLTDASGTRDVPHQVCRGDAYMKVFDPSIPGLVERQADKAFFTYRTDLSRDVICSILHKETQELPGIRLTPDEAALLVDLGAIERGTICQKENAPGFYRITNRPETVIYLYDTLSDPTFVDPRLASPERRQQILDALARLTPVTAELRGREQLGIARSNSTNGKTNTALQVASIVILLKLLQQNRQILEGKRNDVKLTDFTTDFVEVARVKLAQSKLNAIDGRDAEALEFLKFLARPERANPLLIGESGVGKDIIVERAAQLIALKDPRVPRLFRDGKTGLLLIDPIDLQKNTKFVGDMSIRTDLLKKAMKQGHIVYLPEAYDFISAGKHSGGTSESLQSQLKTILTDPTSKWAGSTTLENYQKLMREIPDMRRRFPPIAVEELPPDAIREIMASGVAPKYAQHYGVKILPATVDAAMQKGTEAFVNMNGMPAIDAVKDALVLGIEHAQDRAGLDAESIVVTPEDVVQAVDAKMEKEKRLAQRSVRLYTIGLNVIDEVLPRPSDGSAKVAISPEIAALAARHGIPAERVPELLTGAAGIRTEARLAKLAEANFTPERIVAWLASEPGQAWLLANEARFADTLANRMKAGVPALAMGIAGLLMAEQIADVIGLDPVHHAEERFAFIVFSLPGATAAGGAIGGVMRNRLAGLPYDFVRQAVVIEEGRQVLQLTYEARTTMSRALLAALANNFIVEGSAAQKIAAGARGVVTLPLATIAGMGPGLAASKIADATVGELFPQGSTARGAIALGAFFVPDVYRMFARNRGRELVGRLGLGAFSNLFAYGFMTDLSVMGMQRAALGGGAAYYRSVEGRVAERQFEQSSFDRFAAAERAPAGLESLAMLGAFVHVGAHETLKFIAPGTSSLLHAAEARETGAPFMDEILARDREESLAMQQQLPGLMLSSLVAGAGAERDEARFYTAVDLSAFREEVELEGVAEEIAELIDEKGAAAMEEIEGRYRPEQLAEAWGALERRRLQQQLAMLHFVDQDVNDPIRAIVDMDGLVQQGKEDAFLGLLDGSVSPEAVRTQILALRRAQLIVRILEAKGAKQAKLMALAREAGMTGADGQLVRDATYTLALSLADARDQQPQLPAGSATGAAAGTAPTGLAEEAETPRAAAGAPRYTGVVDAETAAAASDAPIADLPVDGAGEGASIFVDPSSGPVFVPAWAPVSAR